MASSIQILRSTIARERPLPSNLLEGQPAVNLNAQEPGLFFKAADGSLVKIGPAAITSDGSPPNTNPDGEIGNCIGELWLDKSANPAVLKVYDGTQWVDAGSGGGGGGSGLFVRWIYQAIGGETSLSGLGLNGILLSYTPGAEEVFVNGVLITREIDYSAVNGNSITNLVPLSAGDLVTVTSIVPVQTLQLPGQASLVRWTVTATAGQTVLQGADSNGTALDYEPGYEQVFVNGVLLVRGSDYSATNGTTITVTTPLSSGDGVVVLCWSVFSIANISADQVQYSPGWPNSSQRSVASKLSETPSVKDFGAVGDGVTNDADAFGNAAKARPGAVGQNVYSWTYRPDYVTVYVPDGTYNIASQVDTGGRSVLWVLSNGASIPNAHLLNGELYRPGRRMTKLPEGIEDAACTLTVKMGALNNEGAEVVGFTDYPQIGGYTDRDAVALFCEATATQPIASPSTATYSPTSIVPSPALDGGQVKRLREGMIIDTAHTPTKYSGVITGWEADGSAIYVQGWYLANGSGSNPPTTPPNGPGAYVNPVTKVWGQNTNVIIDPWAHASACAGFELGVIDKKAASTGLVGGSHYAWGMDVVVLGGGQKIQAHFIARGAGFSGLRVDDADTGLFYRGPSNAVEAWKNNVRSLLIRGDGTMEVGRQDAAQTTFIDFHSSGNTESSGCDYDSRLYAFGGTSSPGQGALGVTALKFITRDHEPETTNTYSLGTSSKRFSETFSTTLRPGDGTARWTSGTGSPEGNVTAVIGSLYTRTDGGAGTTLYVKESGTGNTGWVAK